MHGDRVTLVVVAQLRFDKGMGVAGRGGAKPLDHGGRDKDVAIRTQLLANVVGERGHLATQRAGGLLHEHGPAAMDADAGQLDLVMLA